MTQATIERLLDLLAQLEEFVTEEDRDTPEYRVGYEAGRRAGERLRAGRVDPEADA